MGGSPVLYLDLDDTVISWVTGSPRPATGAREFILWALTNFEVRWLTTWCPGGEMEASLLTDLAGMLMVPEEELRGIRGFAWEDTGSKLNGLAWLEHVVNGRPFIWLEDDNGVGEVEKRGLEQAGVLDSYLLCNVTRDPEALTRAHADLRRWFESFAEAA